ncbi:MAG: efflux RND transporter permease subunit, partial [Gemmatimonadota bacterium]|nr:efflux RND transporter permease subunit [Gemmatimonadota bacterium]
MGIAGRIAAGFLNSKLTPLVTGASLLVGVLALLATPREEEPQISVPMIDVIAVLPGASPSEAENLLARPIERKMWEIPGVDFVYSMAGEGMTLVTVRFKVGEDQEESTVKVHAKLMAAMDEAPAGASPAMVKPHTIDDVPILTLTLSGEGYGSSQLRQLAIHLEDEIRTIPDVSETSVIGGEPRQFTVTLDPARLAASGVTPGEVFQALQGANVRLPAGEFSTDNRTALVSVGAPLTTPDEVGSVVVSARGGHPVYLRSVADVSDAWGEPTSYVTQRPAEGDPSQAVTIAVSKRRGANAAVVAHGVL